jgi:hypothetical protein
VPTRDFPYSGWYFGQKWGSQAKEITPDVYIERMIWRARIDHFVGPSFGEHRFLGPVHVQEAQPDEIYFVFLDSLHAHSAVIYRASGTTHQLLWKAKDSNPP